MLEPQEILKQVGFEEKLRNLESTLKMQTTMKRTQEPIYQIPYEAAANLNSVLRHAGEQFLQDNNISNFTSVCHHAIQEVKPIMDKRLALWGKETVGSLYNIKTLEEMVDQVSQNMSLAAKK